MMIYFVREWISGIGFATADGTQGVKVGGDDGAVWWGQVGESK